jgi:hypothetical protein
MASFLKNEEYSFQEGISDFTMRIAEKVRIIIFIPGIFTRRSIEFRSEKEQNIK